MRHHLSKLLVYLTAPLLITVSARADLIVNTGSPGMSGSGSDLGAFVGAESFTLTTTTTIKAALFYDYEYSRYWDGTLRYFFFTDNGLLPSPTPLAEGQGPPFTKTCIWGNPSQWAHYKYAFDLTPPLSLSPGKYWFGLQLEADFSDYPPLTWEWTTTPSAQSSARALHGDFTSWTRADYSQLAFALSDSPLVVPEPPPAALLALALASLLRRRPPRPRRT